MIVGVLLNPIAGFGGTLAMHGTDQLPGSLYDAAVDAARAEQRLLRALTSFSAEHLDATLLVPAGLLGSGQLTRAGVPHVTLDVVRPVGRTTKRDTADAARALVAAHVDCLLFAGGDGTATDIASAVGEVVPVIGVPSGVKMHSEVFARSPESAGQLLAQFLRGECRLEAVEVLDVVGDRSSTVGTLMAPASRALLQRAKAVVPAQISEISRGLIARDVVETHGRRGTWVLGPGTTVATVADELGVAATLRGVDVLHTSGVVEQDVTEERLFEIVDGCNDARLVLGVIGGQGFLLGRGNHEVSPRVIERIGVESVCIVASEAKISGLFPPILLVDVGDARALHPLVGYRRVHSGAGHHTVMNVVNAAC